MRLPFQPAAQQPRVAHIGAKQHIEGVAGDRYRSDHALDCDIAEHARRQMPWRPQRARLTHHPERERRRDDDADDGNQSDDPIDAIPDLGAGQDEGDIEKPGDRLQPLDPLLARSPNGLAAE